MRLLVLFLFSICFFTNTMASHLRGGEVTFRLIRCNEYEITLTLYTDTQSPITPGGGTLSLGNGSLLVVPQLNVEIIDQRLRVGKAIFKVIRNYSSGIYSISYLEANRNTGIVNAPNSIALPFFVESQLEVNADFACNRPLTLSTLPIDRGCKGIAFLHNLGGVDADGDSISYELVNPLQGSNQALSNYTLPSDNKFYPGQNYNFSNETKTGKPSISINNVTGNLIWDAPGMQGEFIIAIKAIEWRKVKGQWRAIGYVKRDMQIFVEDCQNNRPQLSLTDLCVKSGATIHQVIRATDPDGDLVKIELFQLSSVPDSPQVSFLNQLQSTRSPLDTARIEMNWVTGCNFARSSPYRFLLKVSDAPALGIPLSTFYTWEIKIVNSAPKHKIQTLNIQKREITLEWEDDSCSSEVYEVWRRIGTSDNGQSICKEGIERSSGYELRAIVSKQRYWTDTEINAGVGYCYRIVSRSANGAKSISSLPYCFGPLQIDAPVLLKTSVLRTDVTAGQVHVRWLSPLQIDRKLFPPPYQYEILRYHRNGAVVPLSVRKITDTTYVDSKVNTQDSVYGYSIILYSPGGITKGNPVDTSAVAFFPKLTAQSLNDGIKLTWEADVPWSNQNEKKPYHYVYRKLKSEKEFTLIDSINVFLALPEENFEYIDRNKNWLNNSVYQYKVSTSGTYRNSLIPDPILNYSNEVFAQPLDNSPPCAVQLNVNRASCEEIWRSDCQIKEYVNYLEWSYPAQCGDDISFYEIRYKSAEADTTSIKLITTPNLSFSHIRFDSFSGCYQVISVDRSGNKSNENPWVCIDNCPTIYIPNLITANADGLNDSFPDVLSDKTDPAKCSRFILALYLKIFNRWGKEVFELNQLSSGSSVEWVGLDHKGNELPSGIYYYEANVIFNTIQADKQRQQFRGWVGLSR